MGDSTRDDSVMGLDLNEEPLVDPPPPPAEVIGSFLEALETERVGIEDRLRQLEAVTARASHRQRWRRSMNNPESAYISSAAPIVEPPATNDGERGRNCKRDFSHLAKALQIDLDAMKTVNHHSSNGDGDNGSFFDCNICLDVARDPILTCCGHLFCWACFFQVPYIDSISKECPVCKGEVIDSNITPIYGNGRNSKASEIESGVKIPPRPRARRVESLRQQRFSRGISHIPVADALRRIRISLGLIEEAPNNVGQTDHRSETDASLSSVSSALNSAERFVDDFEAYVNGRRLRGEMNPNVEVDLSISHPRRRGFNPEEGRGDVS